MIGALFFLLGLLVLLYRDTETVAITVTAVPGGTRVNFNGRCTPEMATRLNAVISSVPPLEEQAAAAVPSEAEAETKTCPQCAEQVKAGAQVCRFCGHEFGADESA